MNEHTNTDGIDRADAVNLAHNIIKRGPDGVTTIGIRTLADAVLMMDAAIPVLCADRDRLLAENQRLRDECTALRTVIGRGADLCERGHGQEWVAEARAALGATK